MILPIYHESKIESTNGKWIIVQFKGEHHMGADHVEYVPSVPIMGVKRFFTTNGSAWYNQHDRCFYMHDSRLIIRIDTEAWKAAYFVSPPKVSFGGITESEDSINMSLYSTGSGAREKNPLNLYNTEWTEGLGSASEGVFPSAWKPWVKI